MKMLRKALLGFLLLTPSITSAALPQQFQNDVVFNGYAKLNGQLEAKQASTSDTGPITALNTAKIYQLRLTGAAPDLQGFAGGVTGKELLVINATGNTLMVRDNAAGAPAANRIRTGSDKDLKFPPNGAFRFVYDGTSNAWRIAGGGGGGTEIQAVVPLAYNENTTELSIPAATNSVDGYLTAADRTAFDAKQPAGDYLTGTTGDVVASGPGNATATIQPLAIKSGMYDDMSIPLRAMGTGSVNANALTAGAIELDTAKVTGVAPVVKGGTGTGTLPAAGQVLASNGTAYQASDLASADTTRASISASVASNVITITLNAMDGTALSASNPAKVSFRRASPGDGSLAVRTVTSPVQLSIPATPTLGLNNKTGIIYVYALDDSCTVALGASAKQLSDNDIQSAGAIGAGSTDPSSLYSNAPRVQVPSRLLGSVQVSTTAGTTTVAQVNTFPTKNTQAAQINLGGQWVGGISITGCGNIWESTSSSYSDFAVQTGCVYTVLPGSVGISPPASQLPGFNLSGTDDAIYEIRLAGFVGQGNANNTSMFRFTDGTVSSEDSQFQSAGLGMYLPGFSGSLNFAKSTSSRFIRVQGRIITGSVSARVFSDVGRPPTVINVYKYPKASSIAATLITGNPVASINAVAQRVTGSFPANPVPGMYRSYLRPASSIAFTESAGDPAYVPSASQPFRMYSAASYSSADASNQPSKYEIFVGKNLPRTAVSVRWGLGVSNGIPSGQIDTSLFASGTDTYGVYQNYDPESGILLLQANYSGSSTSMCVGSNPSNGTRVSTAYFDVQILTNPLAAGITPAENETVLWGTPGYGSTGTTTVRFTASQSAKGSASTHVPDAVNGDYILINEDGQYTVTANAYANTAQYMGITVDSTSTSLPINSLNTYASGNRGMAYIASGTMHAVTRTLNLKKNQRVRMQSGGATLDAGIQYVQMSVLKIASPFETVGAAGGSGNVSTAGVGVLGEKIVRFAFGGSGGSRNGPTVCNSSPCTIYSTNTPGISVTQSGATYYFNLTAAGFSSTPDCFTTAIANGQALGQHQVGFSPTQITMTTYNTNTGAGMNGAFSVQCIGN